AGARGRADVLSDALPHREGEMLWANRRLRRPRNVELEERVAAVRHETPESDPWLKLLEAALAESETSAVWETAVPKPAAERPAKAPLLSHIRIMLDAPAPRGWVRRLLELALPAAARKIDAIALLEAALCHDDARIDGLARSGGADPAVLRVAGQVALLPLLQACARAPAPAAPAAWSSRRCVVGGGCGGCGGRWRLRRERAPGGRVRRAARRARRVGGAAAAPQARHDAGRDRLDDEARPARAGGRRRPRSGPVRAVAVRAVPGRRAERRRRARHGAVDLRRVAPGAGGDRVRRLAGARRAVGRRSFR